MSLQRAPESAAPAPLDLTSSLALPSQVMPSPSAEEKWFREEVQPHELTLRSFLRRQFPRTGDLDDVVQESYLRIVRTNRAGPVRSVKGFLFQVARRMILERLRKRETVTREAAAFVPEAHADPAADTAEQVARAQEQDLLAEAIHGLPRRCREVLVMRKLQGLSYREIALRLGISEKTVEAHLVKGMDRLHAFFAERGLGETDAR